VFGILGCVSARGKFRTTPAPLADVLHWDHYQSVGERLAAYDEQIRAAGTYRRKDGTLEGWTDVMARTTSKPPAEEGRYQLREILLGQGFELK
jgi:hypothetical protein